MLHTAHQLLKQALGMLSWLSGPWLGLAAVPIWGTLLTVPHLPETLLSSLMRWLNTFAINLLQRSAMFILWQCSQLHGEPEQTG